MSDTFHTVFFALSVTLIAGPLWVAWRRTEPRLAPIVAAAVVAGLRWHTARLGWTVRRTLAALNEFFHPQRYYAADEAVETWASEMAATVELPVKPWHSAPSVPDGWRCPTCEQRRCRVGREGRDCSKPAEGEQSAYAAAVEVSRRVGRHTCRHVVAMWSRRMRMRELRDLVAMAPGHYAAKLGRPVMLPRRVVVLP